jgi:hypothetical protein
MWVARTTRCPGARSAQEAADDVRAFRRPLVASGDPDNKLSGLPIEGGSCPSFDAGYCGGLYGGLAE